MLDIFPASVSMAGSLTSGMVVLATLAVMVLLWRPAIRRSEFWRATVTPLASIIGSGFLVVAPLLGYTAGNWAIFAMLGIISLAYAVGGAVRYNIANVEELADNRHASGNGQTAFKWMERAAKLVLAIAYVIAITFYLELLAAFVLRLFGTQNMAIQKSIATGLIVVIGAFGLWRGLRQLESLERYSVDIKLAIITGFLVGLAVVNGQRLVDGSWALSEFHVSWSIETLRKLLGAFLIVQGFETSRYLQNAYSKQVRAATMRCAQGLSAAIYLLFIGLSSIFLGQFESISETGIIGLSEQVAFVLPFMLVVGAAMAQFSAAVADTIASGGLVESATYGKIQHRYVYVVVMLFALALLWSSPILSVIAYASRAFAAYYAIQCAMAALHLLLAGPNKYRFWKCAYFGGLAAVMVLTAVFGIPAESASG